MLVKISKTDVTTLLLDCKWSGSRTTVARTLDFTIVQDDRDSNIPVVNADTGMTVYGYKEPDPDELLAQVKTDTSKDDEKQKEAAPIFVGNIYKIEKNRAQGTLHIIAHDHAFVLAHSKTTRQFNNVAPEDIAGQICKELGVTAGNLAKTYTPVSFIANRKTGYQIIMGAYNEAAKIIKQNAGKDENGKDKEDPKYQLIMNGPKLDVIKKGELIKDYILDSANNMTNSIYSESIENIINQVMIVDKNGNEKDFVKDDDDIKKHSAFQDVYKEDPNKDTQTEAKAMLKKPEREGTIAAIGDYRAVASYSIAIKDSLQNSQSAQFWIKSDTHIFKDGNHEMRLVLEYENMMNDEKVEKDKEK